MQNLLGLFLCFMLVNAVPPIILEPNGKQCPSCLAVLPATNCDQPKMVDCVGLETECFDFSATVTHGTDVTNFVQKGCATRESCDGLKVMEKSDGGVHTAITRAECKAATTSG